MSDDLFAFVDRVKVEEDNGTALSLLSRQAESAGNFRLMRDANVALARVRNGDDSNHLFITETHNAARWYEHRDEFLKAAEMYEEAGSFDDAVRMYVEDGHDDLNERLAHLTVVHGLDIRYGLELRSGRREFKEGFDDLKTVAKKDGIDPATVQEGGLYLAQQFVGTPKGKMDNQEYRGLFEQSMTYLMGSDTDGSIELGLRLCDDYKRKLDLGLADISPDSVRVRNLGWFFVGMEGKGNKASEAIQYFTKEAKHEVGLAARKKKGRGNPSCAFQQEVDAWEEVEEPGRRYLEAAIKIGLHNGLSEWTEGIAMTYFPAGHEVRIGVFEKLGLTERLKSDYRETENVVAYAALE